MAIWDGEQELPLGTFPLAVVEQEGQEELLPDIGSSLQLDQRSTADAEALAAIN